MDGFGEEPRPEGMTARSRKVFAGCSWSIVLAIATATAILMSGLNGLVQVVKVIVEFDVFRG